VSVVVMMIASTNLTNYGYSVLINYRVTQKPNLWPVYVKWSPCTLCHNFDKCWPVFRFFSLTKK